MLVLLINTYAAYNMQMTHSSLPPLDTSSLINLKIILVLFEIMIGLKINYDNSHIYKIGTS